MFSHLSSVSTTCHSRHVSTKLIWILSLDALMALEPKYSDVLFDDGNSIVCQKECCILARYHDKTPGPQMLICHCAMIPKQKNIF